MSFQLLFESTRISKFLESKGKIIPSFRSGIREAAMLVYSCIVHLNSCFSFIVSYIDSFIILDFYLKFFAYFCVLKKNPKNAEDRNM